MTIEEQTGSRAQFLARLQQFMDRTLKDLDKATESKDSDEKEIAAVRNVLLKIGSLWKDALARTNDDPRPMKQWVPKVPKGTVEETRES